MKINGARLTTASEVIIPIVRSTGNLFFVAHAIDDPGEYERLIKLPELPTMEEPGKAPVKIETPAYKKILNNSFECYIAFYIVKSLVKIGKIEDVEEVNPATKETETKRIKVFHPVEWETIDLDNLTTYQNWRQELLDAGLTSGECTRIHNGVMEANSLTETGVDKAREDFLALPEVL